MGAWGTGLYDDDVTADVKDAYLELLEDCTDEHEACKKFIKKHKFFTEDEDDRPLFWFALADTQWKLGRLMPEVKECALKELKIGENLERWREETDEKITSKRKKVLDDLEKRLNSPQPPRKKISKPRVYKCPWQFGDVFALKLQNDYSEEKAKYGDFGNYILFQKVRETEHYPNHINPVVLVKITQEPTLKSFKENDYVRINTNVEKNLYGYFLHLRITSKTQIPKDIIFVGNTEIIIPEKRIIKTNRISYFGAFFKNFESEIMDSYFRFNFPITNDKNSI